MNQNSLNVVIPIGGLGTRFRDVGYSPPKPFIPVKGKPLIEWVISNLSFKGDDTLIIIYNSQLEKVDIESFLRNKYPLLKILFHKLQSQTRGACESVYQGVRALRPYLQDKPLLSLDCDTYYSTDILGICRTVKENAIVYSKTRDHRPIYSYITMSDSGEVVSVVEKIKISDNANTGAYFFCSTDYFLEKASRTVEEMSKEELEMKGEIYMSTLYSNIIEDSKALPFKDRNPRDKVRGLVVSENDFHVLGTPLQHKLFNEVEEPRVFCFDLDGTLVTFPEIHGDYTTVKPIQKNINMCNSLYSKGHTIIINTARRMKTHQSNQGRVLKDIGRITFNTLDTMGILYHEIYFGKPNADFYIDDKAVNPRFGDLEKDLGFYDVTNPTRAFNSISQKKMDIIRKSTDYENRRTLLGEIYWYRHIEDDIKDLFPRLINYDSNGSFYEIEKIKGIDTSHLYVSNCLTKDNLLMILKSIKRIHFPNKEMDFQHIDGFVSQPSNESLLKTTPPLTQCIDLYSNYLSKVTHRYKKYDYSKYSNSEELYRKLDRELTSYQGNNVAVRGRIHGDPIFSNILMTQEQVKFIDMRGLQGDVLSIYGDVHYDLAKIYQSIVGYEYVLHNDTVDVDVVKRAEEVFFEFVSENYTITIEQLKVLTASLFFSLIPIHDVSDGDPIVQEKCRYWMNMCESLLN